MVGRGGCVRGPVSPFHKQILIDLGLHIDIYPQPNGVVITSNAVWYGVVPIYRFACREREI